MAGRGNVHFIRSTQARAADVLAVAGKPLWRDCETAFARIDELCGDGAARLFAEPNVKEQEGRLVVAWFGSFNDDPKQLDTLDRGMRARVVSALAARIEALRPALADREIGETVAAMLNLADESSIVAVGETPVLTSWGMLPEEARSSRAAFVRHSERTIGSYLPSGISPRVPGQLWTVAGSLGTAGTSPLPRAASPKAASPAPEIPALAAARPTRPSRRVSLWPVLAISVVFAGCLIYAAWPGNLVYPEALAPPRPRPLVNSSEVNRSLEERIGKIKAELAKVACDADASVLGPQIKEPEKPDAANATPPPPGSTQALLATLDSATVLVLAPLSEEQLSTGSGFFISKRDILTNNHVVEGAGDTVFVASKALGRAVPARVVAKAAASATGDPDFALLQVGEDDAPSGVTALQLSTGIGRLDSVIAGGFPGFVMSMDKTYREIINGDTSGIGNLEMVVTQGSVMAMPRDGATKVITHSANISPGNSGGPLSDACGRAVGVNTFMILDGQNAQKLNFSLSARDAIQFLSSNGVSVTAADKPCIPAAGAVAGQPRPAQ